MKKPLDIYFDASNVDDKLRGTLRENMLSLIPSELPQNPKDAVISMKDTLYNKEGFSYDSKTFLAQDVIAKRKINCLSGPLLVGTLLAEKGIDIKYNIQINLQDEMPVAEMNYMKQLEEETNYDNPILATSPTGITPLYRFAPLEHATINVNGTPVEITQPDNHDTVPSEKTISNLRLDQFIETVYHDRAIYAIADENPEDAINLLKTGMNCWNGHGSSYALLSLCAFKNFDDVLYKKAINQFKKIGGNDSRSLVDRYIVDDMSNIENTNILQRALKKYPTYATALELQLTDLVKKDTREAKYLTAIVSQMYADSTELDLGNFISSHAKTLSNLYGRDIVLSQLEQFSEDSEMGKSQWGDFNYHLANFNLTNDTNHLGEAEESIVTPLDDLVFLHHTKGTSHYDTNRSNQLEKNYGGSELYKQTKQRFLNHNKIE